MRTHLHAISKDGEIIILSQKYSSVQTKWALYFAYKYLVLLLLLFELYQ